ncbi:hypothetical protein B0H14DRAFT_3586609 [Mycena olivaceomarginata]|nr:hypothetical protein B0H14DRAFT_3586609 [Mycena olivaceomarginata]
MASSFSLNGTHIEGGTFNSVAGNMSQVFNSHVIPAGLLPGNEVSRDHPRLEGGHSSQVKSTYVEDVQYLIMVTLAITTGSSGSIGPIRGQRVLRNRDTRPYEPSYSSQSPTPEMVAVTYGLPVYPSQFQRPLQNQDAPAQGWAGQNNSNTFNSIAGDMTQLSVTSYGESGVPWKLSMTQESASRNRLAIQDKDSYNEELHSWSTDTSTESTILWLHGCAGAGKSAIAQMFAKSLQIEGRLGASFFFQRGHSKRGTWNLLIPTIAYQLATSVTELLLPIQQAVEGDKLVIGRALAISFQALLVEPLKKLSDIQRTPVIVLDGLDECADHKIQQQILRLFIDAIRHHNLHLRLLIVSRPEPHLREVFETGETSAICQHFALSADKSAYRDIRTYFQAEFSRMRCEFIARGISLEPEWPSPDAVDRLVSMSSATFIYATTVIHFIDDEYHHPADRLNSVLELNPQSTASLDDLYTQILSTIPQEQEGLQLRILHTICIGKEETIGRILVDPEEIDILLNLRTGTCRLILRRVHSLFKVPPIQTRFGFRAIWAPVQIDFLHASFSDYLSDTRRSRRWAVSHHLSNLLKNATPSEALVDLLRNRTVQNHLFLNRHKDAWPKRGPPYPLDLVQLWDDLRAVAGLYDYLHVSKDPSTATFKYDAIYTELFPRHPELRLVLQYQVVAPALFIHRHLPLFGWTGTVLRPFLKFPELFPLPFPDGDSPLDFLADPRRAGRLYSEPSYIAEELVLRWIGRARRVLTGGPCELYPCYLKTIEKCRTSQRLLREFATFNLSDLCRQMAIDVRAHENFHLYIVSDGPLCAVLDWLRSFPDDPLPRQVLAFWERQVNAMRLCMSANESESDSDSDSGEPWYRQI